MRFLNYGTHHIGIFLSELRIQHCCGIKIPHTSGMNRLGWNCCLCRNLWAVHLYSLKDPALDGTIYVFSQSYISLNSLYIPIVKNKSNALTMNRKKSIFRGSHSAVKKPVQSFHSVRIKWLDGFLSVYLSTCGHSAQSTYCRHIVKGGKISSYT